MQRIQENHKVDLADFLLLGISDQAPRLNQNGARAPFLNVIPKGSWLKGIVVLAHLAWNQFLQELVHPCNGLHGPSANFIDLRGFVVCRRQQGNRGLLGGIDHVVVDLLIVEVEAKLGLKVVSRFFQDHRLWRNQGNCITVEVDIQGISPLECICPIRVEHGDKLELQLGS